MDAVQAWKTSAADSWDTAKKLIEAKKYAHCLFFVHLALEKLVKGLHQHLRHEPALPLHNLYKLAINAGLEINSELEKELNEISTFNVSARYDDYKRSFYEKADESYAKEWFDRGRKIYELFLDQIQ